MFILLILLLCIVIFLGQFYALGLILGFIGGVIWLIHYIYREKHPKVIDPEYKQMKKTHFALYVGIVIVIIHLLGGSILPSSVRYSLSDSGITLYAFSVIILPIPLGIIIDMYVVNPLIFNYKCNKDTSGDNKIS